MICVTSKNSLLGSHKPRISRKLPVHYLAVREVHLSIMASSAHEVGILASYHNAGIRRLKECGGSQEFTLCKFLLLSMTRAAEHLRPLPGSPVVPEGLVIRFENVLCFLVARCFFRFP